MMNIDPFALPRVRLEEKRLLPNTCGLYFVLTENRILYIGKTENGFKSRWQGWSRKGHHREHQLLQMPSEVFIAYWVVPERGRDLLDLEARARKAFNPELNQTEIITGSVKNKKPKKMRVFEWIASKLSITQEEAKIYFPDGETTPGYPNIPDMPIKKLRQLAKASEY